jgi:hypothetical protein
LAGDASNRLQNAHVIGFGVGVVYLALTPDYLDSAANIVTAHQKTCNKGSELGRREAMARLRTLRVVELPSFLSAEVLEMWQATHAEQVATAARPRD